MEFELPDLLVGTLDSLMNLSDDLTKTDVHIEAIIRKIERLYNDMKQEGDDPQLTVEGLTVEQYITEFTWNVAKYSTRRPLPDLVMSIKQSMAKVEDEMSRLIASSQEKMQQLSALRRKHATFNPTHSSLSEYLIPQNFQHIPVFFPEGSSEFFKTMLALVPEKAVEEWEDEYGELGSDIAGFHQPNWEENRHNIGTNDGNFGPELNRKRETGSPFIPGSLHKIGEIPGHQTTMYAVTFLKGHYEAGTLDGDEFVNGRFISYEEDIQRCCRERLKVVLREITPDLLGTHVQGGEGKHEDEEEDKEPAKSKEEEEEEALSALQQTQATIVRWSQVYYSFSIISLLHVKAIRVFVESVLLFGLPLDFTCCLIDTNDHGDIDAANAKVTKALEDLIKEMAANSKEGDDEALMFMGVGDEEEDDQEEFLPFVKVKIGI
jgi:V-type H+-transporting ATPase subunit C